MKYIKNVMISIIFLYAFEAFGSIHHAKSVLIGTSFAMSLSCMGGLAHKFVTQSSRSMADIESSAIETGLYCGAALIPLTISDYAQEIVGDALDEKNGQERHLRNLICNTIINTDNNYIENVSRNLYQLERLKKQAVIFDQKLLKHAAHTTLLLGVVPAVLCNYSDLALLLYGASCLSSGVAVLRAKRVKKSMAEFLSDLQTQAITHKKYKEDEILPERVFALINSIEQKRANLASLRGKAYKDAYYTLIEQSIQSSVDEYAKNHPYGKEIIKRLELVN